MSDQLNQQAPDPQASTPTPIPQPQGSSGLAIAGLVLGILAAASSFIPIINNGSFFVAIVGLILSIAGLMRARQGKCGGKGIAIAGTLLCIVALAITLAVQAACSAALDSATSNGNASVASSTQVSSGNGASSVAQTDTSYMPIGQTVNLDDGLSITVNSIEQDLTNYDDSQIVGINVTYTNNGSSNASFSIYDWKAEDASGAQRSQAYYSEASDQLNSGTLSAGGSVTGNVYFDAPVVKVYYYSNMLVSDSNIAWVIG